MKTRFYESTVSFRYWEDNRWEREVRAGDIYTEDELMRRRFTAEDVQEWAKLAGETPEQNPPKQLSDVPRFCDEWTAWVLSDLTFSLAEKNSQDVQDILWPLLGRIWTAVTAMPDAPSLPPCPEPESLADAANELKRLRQAVTPKSEEPPAGGTVERKRDGRPRKEEPSKADIVLSLLVLHHAYESGGSIGNPEPIGLDDLVNMAGGKVSKPTISRCLKGWFGSYKLYVATCHQDTLGPTLSRLQGETSKELTDPLPEERPYEDKQLKAATDKGHRQPKGPATDQASAYPTAPHLDSTRIWPAPLQEE